MLIVGNEKLNFDLSSEDFEKLKSEIKDKISKAENSLKEFKDQNDTNIKSFDALSLRKRNLSQIIHRSKEILKFVSDADLRNKMTSKILDLEVEQKSIESKISVIVLFIFNHFLCWYFKFIFNEFNHRFYFVKN